MDMGVFSPENTLKYIRTSIDHNKVPEDDNYPTPPANSKTKLDIINPDKENNDNFLTICGGDKL